MSLVRKGKTYEEIYGVEGGMRKRKQHSKVMKGRVQSEEHKRKNSIANKGRPKSEHFKKWVTANNPAKRPDVAKKISDKLKGRKQSKETITKRSLTQRGKKHNLSSHDRERLRKWMMKIREEAVYTDTSLEKILHQQLSLLGIPFEKQFREVGRPDIFIEPNICIFVDGCYHHACQQCFVKDKFKERQWNRIKRDAYVSEVLTSKGYVVLRFWEHEINDNLQTVMARVLAVSMAQLVQDNKIVNTG